MVMNHNINFGLFIIIIALLIVLVTLSIYCQNIQITCQKKLNGLDESITILKIKEQKLNQTKYQLEIKKQREKELNSKYELLRDKLWDELISK